MRKSRFSEEQIVGMLRKEHAAAGRRRGTLCRAAGANKRASGGKPSTTAWKETELKRLKVLEEENAQLSG